MRTITITFQQGGCGWDVHEDGKCCNGLSWDEMLGQVAMLTLPESRVGKGFSMMTPEEWEARNKAMPDVQERIVTCVTGLHSEIRRHDDMALREHNPERYSKMCVARHIDDVDASLESFFNEVKEARLRHQIADVHLITRVIIDQDSSESPALGFAHFGAVQEAESMCAWAMGRAIEERRKFISHIGSEGTRAARK